MSAEAPTEDAADVADGDVAPDAEPPAGARRRSSSGPLIALGLAAAIAIGALVVAIVGGDDVSATAVRVNSTEVSQKTFNSQLRELVPLLREQGAPTSEFTDASVPSTTAAQLAQVYVGTELLRGHVDVTAADRRDLLAQSGKELAQYDAELRVRLVDLTLMTDTLVSQRGEEGATRFLRQLARRADIHVDPRYGFWNPALAQVCPPTGCSTATAGG